MAEKLSFTKAAILAVNLPDKGKRTYIYDSKVSGLVLCVTSSGTRSFQVYKKIHGKPIRITLGRFPEISIENARRQAKKAIGQIAEGGNPMAEKKEKRIKGVTLSQVFDDYLKARKDLKLGTLKDYRRIMKEGFSDWQNKALKDISKDVVAKRHTSLGKRSEARANNSMRLLRALFNFAMGEYENNKGRPYFSVNPVDKLSHSRAWFRIKRRNTLIKAHDIPAWFCAVRALGNSPFGKAEIVRDYLLLLIFTGLRREEAAQLMWKQVDMRAKTLTIVDPKNRETHVLPLSDFLYQILAKRKIESDSDYVFPGDGVKGYLVEPRRQVDKVRDLSEVKFTLHDLRRTFTTIAESLDIPAYALKRLLNHKMNQDVTAGYIVSDVERLRKPMQAVTNRILELAGVAEERDTFLDKPKIILLNNQA